MPSRCLLLLRPPHQQLIVPFRFSLPLVSASDGWAFRLLEACPPPICKSMGLRRGGSGTPRSLIAWGGETVPLEETFLLHSALSAETFYVSYLPQIWRSPALCNLRGPVCAGATGPVSQWLDLLVRWEAMSSRAVFVLAAGTF